MTTSAANIIPDTPVADSRAAASVLRPLLAKRRRFDAAITGPPLCGRTEVLAAVALEAADEWGIGVYAFALLGPDEAAAHIFKRTVADMIEFGSPPEMFCADLTGSLVEVAYAHSGRFARTGYQQRKQFLDQFLALIKRAAGLDTGTKTDRALARRRRDLVAGMTFEGRVRARGDDLAAAHAAAIDRGDALPALSMLVEMSERWADFRRRARVLDDADILNGTIYPDPDCPLVLVDEAHEIGPLGQAAIGRLFPRAACVAAGEPNSGMLARIKPAARIELE